MKPRECNYMLKFIRKMLRDESGPTALEYSLIAGLVAVMTIAGLTTVGTTVNSKYNTIATKAAS